MDLAKRMKDLRTSKGISVYKLSRLSEISQNYIHKIEKGESQVSVYVLEKLLSSLDITLSEFFHENGDVLYPSEFEWELLKNVRGLEQDSAELVLSVAQMLKKLNDGGDQ